jgi:NADPH:quinone reductase
MRAIEITESGGPHVLKITERPTPTPGAGEVLVKVVAAGVNRPDVHQRRGGYAPPPGVTDIPGLEIAGHVEAVGPGASSWRIGDALCALVVGGGYAEYCTAPELQCLPIPAGLSMAEAAAVPETFFTVWTNVFERGRLQRGESFLVHGGTSGIGTTAIQMARAFGARTFATGGSDEKCAACQRLGAELAVNYQTTDWVPLLRERAGGGGIDVILDMVGGEYTPRNLDLLAVDGRLVQIGFFKTPMVSFDLMHVMRRRLTITGSLLRPRTPEQKGAIARALREKVWPLIERGEVRPIVDTIFPLAQAADAHRLMEAGTFVGKIVLGVE